MRFNTISSSSIEGLFGSGHPVARLFATFSAVRKISLLIRSFCSKVEKIYDLYEDDFQLFGYWPDDALRIAKEKRRRRNRPPIEEFSDLGKDDFEIFYPDLIN